MPDDMGRQALAFLPNEIWIHAQISAILNLRHLAIPVAEGRSEDMITAARAGWLQGNRCLIMVLLCVAYWPSAVWGQRSSIQSAPSTHGASQTGLPTTAEVDEWMKRTFGYDPATKWKIYDVRPSSISGVADVLVSVNNQSPQHIFVNAETQTAIVGGLIPFGRDPFAAVRGRLQAVDGPTQGSSRPSIIMVAFSDLECKHCKAAQPVLDKLVTDFPQIRYVFQQFPLPATMHPWAMKAAEYSDCVARGDAALFWKYANTIFEKQDEITPASVDDELKSFASTLGLDPQRISSCAAQPKTEAHVKESVALGESLDVTEVPTVFLNGRRVLGIAGIPYERLKNLVQFEIDHAGK